MPDETAEVWLCHDCAYELANVRPDSRWTSDGTCPECWDAGVECEHESHAVRDFDTRPCARCETPLAGARFRHAYWRS